MTSDTATELLRLRMRQHLDAFPRLRIHEPSLKQAAVAVVVVAGVNDEPAFLLTRRGGRLKRHRGQWALPGGRVDAGETAVEAALRELREELGLNLGPERVLGLLDDFPTRSGFRVTPVVMWGDTAQHLVPDPDEVEAVYRVPLHDLEHPEVPRLERIPQSDRPVLSIFFNSLQHRVYAPTAAMIYQFHEVAVNGRTTRVREFEQPVFAWR